MHYKFQITNSRGTISKYFTHSKRLFLKKLRTIKFVEDGLKVFIRVNYGDDSHNEGEYETEIDVWNAVNAFMQEGKQQ